MNESAGEKAIELLLIGDGRRIENEIIKNLVVVECSKGYDAGYNYDDKRYRYGHDNLLMMVFFVFQDSACPVHLFRQYQPYQLVGENQGRQRPL